MKKQFLTLLLVIGCTLNLFGMETSEELDKAKQIQLHTEENLQNINQKRETINEQTQIIGEVRETINEQTQIVGEVTQIVGEVTQTLEELKLALQNKRENKTTPKNHRELHYDAGATKKQTIMPKQNSIFIQNDLSVGNDSEFNIKLPGFEEKPRSFFFQRPFTTFGLSFTGIIGAALYWNKSLQNHFHSFTTGFPNMNVSTLNAFPNLAGSQWKSFFK